MIVKSLVPSLSPISGVRYRILLLCFFLSLITYLDRVCISVADRGPGIPAERRSSLFTRFGLGEVRTDDSTGLGLFIVRTVVSAHGGRVSLDCPAEGGSVFTVELPTSDVGR